MIVVEQRQEMGGGRDRRTFEGRSSTLGQAEDVFMEGRADNSVDPKRLGVGLLRQLGLKEDRGLSAQGRHFAEAGKSVGGDEDEKGGLEMMRTELTLTHGAFICDGWRAFLNAGSSTPVRFDLISDHCPKTVTAHHLGRFQSYDREFFCKICRFLAPLCSSQHVLGLGGKGRQENSKGEEWQMHEARHERPSIQFSPLTAITPCLVS